VASRKIAQNQLNRQSQCFCIINHTRNK